MNTQQRGFGIVGILLAIVILAGIGLIGWYVYSSRNTNEEAKDTTATSTTQQQKSDERKQYLNTEYKFSFLYPRDWLDIGLTEDDTQNGVIKKLASPEQDQKYREYVDAARAMGALSDSTVKVSRWENINNDYARGGASIDEPTYGSLNEYLHSAFDGKTKQKVGELTIDGQKVYEVLIGGHGQTYGIMFEKNDGVFQIEFPAIHDKESSTPQVKEIIDSLEFN